MMKVVLILKRINYSWENSVISMILTLEILGRVSKFKLLALSVGNSDIPQSEGYKTLTSF